MVSAMEVLSSIGPYNTVSRGQNALNNSTPDEDARAFLMVVMLLTNWLERLGRPDLRE